MNIEETILKDCFLIKPQIYEDNRGYFYESFNFREFYEKVGKPFNMYQVNVSKSCKGTIRGLHFQKSPYEQAKIIKVISGEIIDVAVDLRHNSATFGKSVSVILSDKNRHQLYIPKGFAHGFLTLSDIAIIEYLVDAPYNKDSEDGIFWDSPDLNIEWGTSNALNPFIGDNIILSDKDKNWHPFDKEKKYFCLENKLID